ncbi:MAG TPA: hypothetical protein VMH33_02020 [Solirubrobacterales bacterium]|nr:hypothetical protein [Solirubrobacterales bacterium]
MARLRAKLTYANVMVTILAVVVIGGGSAYAASQALPANSVGTRQIQAKAVTPGKLSYSAKKALAGKPGPVGPIGKTGLDGATGEQGKEGPQGDTGPRGQPGPKGEKGEEGPEGPPGDKGDEGPRGPEGPKGDEGARGPEGPKGDEGARGPEGPKGEPGEPSLSYSAVVVDGSFSGPHPGFESVRRRGEGEYCLKPEEGVNYYYPVASPEWIGSTGNYLQVEPIGRENDYSCNPGEFAVYTFLLEGNMAVKSNGVNFIITLPQPPPAP